MWNLVLQLLERFHMETLTGLPVMAVRVMKGREKMKILWEFRARFHGNHLFTFKNMQKLHKRLDSPSS